MQVLSLFPSLGCFHIPSFHKMAVLASSLTLTILKLRAIHVTQPFIIQVQRHMAAIIYWTIILHNSVHPLPHNQLTCPANPRIHPVPPSALPIWFKGKSVLSSSLKNQNKTETLQPGCLQHKRNIKDYPETPKTSRHQTTAYGQSQRPPGYWKV